MSISVDMGNYFIFEGWPISPEISRAPPRYEGVRNASDFVLTSRQAAYIVQVLKVLSMCVSCRNGFTVLERVLYRQTDIPYPLGCFTMSM